MKPIRASIFIAACLAGLFATSAGAAAPAKGAAPRFETLSVEIRPEHDRPAALVILIGQLAADVALPAAISLRIPASSNGPSAVAFANGDREQLYDLGYDRSNAKDYITLHAKLPGRVLHLEFYDNMVTGSKERRYHYVWPGDMAVDKFAVSVEEPASATDFSTRPELGETTVGNGGLRYRGAMLGAVPAGKPVAIDLRYTKTDTRPTTEILNLSKEAPVPQTTGEVVAPSTMRPEVILVLGIGLPLLLAAGTGYWWWRRRSMMESGAIARVCTKCGHKAKPGDRFCAKCGKALA